ncbi:hypothetical protein [Nonomuraea sp. bgisy101]|uniref:hypothetical protein n=1 Tax=Nonomuraea sp. bgisy101 TaxID=3413784 RepID=UPI003D702ADB
MEAQVRALTMATTLTSTSSTTLTRIAWASFPRWGSTVSVDVVVTLSSATSFDVLLTADGTQIDLKTITASGTVTVSGFLLPAWAFGARKVVEVLVKVNSGSPSVAGTLRELACQLLEAEWSDGQQIDDLFLVLPKEPQDLWAVRAIKEIFGVSIIWKTDGGWDGLSVDAALGRWRGRTRNEVLRQAEGSPRSPETSSREPSRT